MLWNVSFFVINTMKKFYSYLLSQAKESDQISFQEIPTALSIRKRHDKLCVKNTVKNGLIPKEAIQCKCLKNKPLLSGKNIYTLTDKGQVNLNGSKQGSLTLQRLTNQGGYSL
jgi:hypothetical protein